LVSVVVDDDPKEYDDPKVGLEASSFLVSVVVVEEEVDPKEYDDPKVDLVSFSFLSPLLLADDPKE